MYGCSQTKKGCCQKVQKIDIILQKLFLATPEAHYEHSNKKAA